jgi:hypothetical protein
MEEVDMPWWNKRAIRYLSRHIRPGDLAFEWGSGGSTVWLTRQGVSVTSIEHDPVWAAKVIDLCPETNVRLIPAATHGQVRSEPQLQDEGQHFFDDYVAAIDPLEDCSFDIMIVDGICRMECVRRGASKVKPGGVLVLDDTDFRCLAPSKRLLPGWRIVSLSGFKSTRDVRETTFFHRPK